MTVETDERSKNEKMGFGMCNVGDNATSQRVIQIRIKSKAKRKKADEMLNDIAHFKNLLILLLNAYHDAYGVYALNISFWYAMLTGKDYRSKNEKQQAGFEEFMKNVKNSEKVEYYLRQLREKKVKIDNNYLLQTTIRQVANAYKSYLRASADYKENPGKYRGRPQPPRQKKVKELPSVSVEFNDCSIKVEYRRLTLRLRIGKGTSISIALPEEAMVWKIKSVRLFRIGSDYYVHVVYREIPGETKSKGKYGAGIDVGLNNLLAVLSDNPEIKSFIVSGKEIKAFNQWYNKQRAALQERLSALKKESKESGADHQIEIERLIEKFRHLSALRKRFFDNELHKISKKLVTLLYETGHDTIYIGTGGTNSKQQINLGKRNNQNFVYIPFRRLIDLIVYKAAELGMRVVETEEHYTSKSSSLSDDIVDIQKKVEAGKRREVKFSGKRTYRGLFHDLKLNKVFNADLNGALNILKAGAKLHEWALPLKISLFKLATPIRMNLDAFYYKVTCESLRG